MVMVPQMVVLISVLEHLATPSDIARSSPTALPSRCSGTWHCDALRRLLQHNLNAQIKQKQDAHPLRTALLSRSDL